MRADLLRFAQGRPIEAPAPATTARPPRAIVAPPPSTGAQQTTPPPPEAAPSSSRTGWFFVIILLLFVVLGGGLWALAQTLGVFEESPNLVTVPNVVGDTIDLATQRLEGDGFVVGDLIDRESSEPPGTVLDQAPSANEQVEEGATITLTVSVGVGEATLEDLRGRTEGEAREILAAAGFTNIQQVQREESDEEEPGIVLRTEPGPGGPYPKDEPIVLVVARTPTTTTTTTTEPPPTTTTTTAPPTTTTTAPPPTTTTTTAPPTTTTTTTEPTTTTTEP